MKRFFFYFLISILVSCYQIVSGQQKNHRQIIIIDPGHGGNDLGAVGVNGLREKEVTLKVALEVIRLNRELFYDTLEIYSTRYTDTLISLSHRTKLAKALNVNVYVSIHCNQASREEAQGVEVFLSHKNAKSEILAYFFLNGLSEILGYKNRGVKYKNFQVLRETTDYPSVLLELGFLSNKHEARHNEKESSISAFALLILETIIKYLSHD